jgi:cardiolipin synthase
MLYKGKGNSNKNMKPRRNNTGGIRLFIVVLAILAQLVLFAYFAMWLRHFAFYAYAFFEVFGLIMAFSIIEKHKNSAYTLAWVIIILIMPIYGSIIYIMWGRSGTNTKKSRRIRNIMSESLKRFTHDSELRLELQERYPNYNKISVYLEKEGFPLYKNTRCTYYPLGELQFEAMIEDLKKAQKFIFLEYYILSKGYLWDKIHAILKEKAAEGVEVRLLYDDFGSILTVPDNLIKTLKDENIQVYRFNPVYSSLSRLYINYRNHQKIAMIDGIIGYTGGTNLADEYANLYERYGHWKDTAIRLEGEAVYSLTVTFLQMWETESNQKEDYEAYRPVLNEPIPDHGFYQPFNDGPVNHPSNPAESVYRQILYSAHDYVYITTPYLVVEDSMTDALCLAASSGIDVRIITPRVWDRWYVHMVTRSNYGRLLENGVRIYEYTPGYIHAKTIISDDIHAVTGSINMDYRSFYLHFENGVWICGASVLQDIRQDIESLFLISDEITLEKWKHRPLHLKIIQSLLRVLIPLL